MLGEKTRILAGNPPEAEEKTPGDPIHPVEEPPPPGLEEAGTSPPSLDEEEDEVTTCDVYIPDSIARALLDVLQDKRKGSQLPAAMVPLARARPSQLQHCIAKGSEPTEAVVQT